MSPESRFQLGISFLLFALFGIQIFYYYPQLPDRMASKFGATGQVISTLDKNLFFALYGGTLLFMFFVFGVLGILIGKIPPSLLNIPNKDYWLAEERKKKTFTTIQIMMLRFNNATLLLLIALFQFIIDTHLTKTSPQQITNKFIVLLVIYLGYTAVWTVQLCLKFKKPKAEIE